MAGSDPLPSDTPLGEVQDWFLSRVDGGVKCPVCTQHAQIYRWSLYSTAAQALMLLYRCGGTTQFTHVNEIKRLGHKGQGDCSRLVKWGLVEEEPVVREDGGRAGYWRVTALGEDFINERSTVGKYVWTYAGDVVERGGPQISIREALGRKFDYDSMMAGAFA